MRTTLLLILFFAVSGYRACAQNDEVLLGEINVQDLLMLPGWFGDDYRNYMPSRTYLDKLPEHLDGVRIVCFLGTWCSDSRREVPRMIKLIQLLKLPPETLQLIGVNREKHAPNGEDRPYNIELVPTFIIIRDGDEIGRIVEQPYGSLEKHLLGILDPQPEPDPAAAGVDADGDLPMPAHPDMPQVNDEQKRMMDEHAHPPPPGDARAPQDKR